MYRRNNEDYPQRKPRKKGRPGYVETDPKAGRRLHCYDGCNAPICLAFLVQFMQWFPDEEICSAREFRRTHLVLVQRKIRRLCLKEQIDPNLCFTAEMLMAIKTPRKGTRGINPEFLYRNGGGPAA